MHQHDTHTHGKREPMEWRNQRVSLYSSLSYCVHTYIVCVCLFYPDSLIRFSSFVCAQHNRGNIWRRRSPTKTLSDQLLVHVPQRVTTFLPPFPSPPPLVYSNLIPNESTGVSRLITQPNARFQLLSLGIFHEIVEWNKKVKSNKTRLWLPNSSVLIQTRMQQGGGEYNNNDKVLI